MSEPQKIDAKKPIWANRGTSGASSGVTKGPAGSGPKKVIVKQKIGGNVSNQVNALKQAGIQTVNKGPQKLKTPKIVTDVREEVDKHGNITRTTIKMITEVDGVTKREERSVEHIPASEA